MVKQRQQVESIELLLSNSNSKSNLIDSILPIEPAVYNYESKRLIQERSDSSARSGGNSLLLSSRNE